jgi:signal transduction histidine kinase
VEDALTRTAGGAGIGLSLVKKLMQAMGGSVTAADSTGYGVHHHAGLPNF